MTEKPTTELWMKQMRAEMSKPLVSFQHSQFSSTIQHWFFSRKNMLGVSQGLGENRRLIDCNILYLYILHLSSAWHFTQREIQYELFWTLIDWLIDEHCCSAFLTAQRCSLLTLFMYFQVQAPKTIQSSAALLSPLANSPRENSCGSPVQKTSRRSRGFKKTPEKQEWLSASPKQNDNCQVQWLLGCHANLQNVYTLAF